MSVAIDAMILIWGLQQSHYKGKKPTKQDVAEMRRRSLLLLHTLAEDKETVILPSVAASELLLGVEPSEHGRFIAELQERFFIPPYDIHAASLAAQLWQATRELPKAEQPERVRLRHAAGGGADPVGALQPGRPARADGGHRPLGGSDGSTQDGEPGLVRQLLSSPLRRGRCPAGAFC